MRKFSRFLRVGMLTLVVLSLPCSLMAKPIVVNINDAPSGVPDIEIIGAPNGWTMVPDDVDPTTVASGIITLVGVDVWGSINEPDENGWRFRDCRDWTTLPPYYLEDYPEWGNVRMYKMAVDIVWIQHDPETGELQVCFDSAKDGTWWWNGGVLTNSDADAGVVVNSWVTLYADDTLVLRYKPHTQRPQVLED